MIPALEHHTLLTILYWLLMLPIAILVLVRVTAFWAEAGPGTLSKAVWVMVLMGAAVFLAYDFSGYVFARMMQDPGLGIGFPPNYHYWDWIREPLGLKWHVLSFLPMIRYLPVVFGLMAGGIVQVMLWRIPFRAGMIVFVSQLVLDVFAMAHALVRSSASSLASSRGPPAMPARDRGPAITQAIARRRCPRASKKCSSGSRTWARSKAPSFAGCGAGGNRSMDDYSRSTTFAGRSRAICRCPSEIFSTAAVGYSSSTGLVAAVRFWPRIRQVRRG